MAKRLIIVLAFITSLTARAQCPQVYDYLGNLSSNPYWISCTGSNYLLNFQSNSSWGPYTIDWGDGSPPFAAAAYSANSSITHNYGATVDTFVVTLIIPAQTCTLTGVVVMETAVNAAISLPVGGSASGCVPATIQFKNSSTNVSPTTSFTWDFGDGSTPVVMSYTNAGQNVAHTYTSSNCPVTVTLQAKNYCSMGVSSAATYSPVQIYDKDVPAILQSAFVQCAPSNAFTFTNVSTQNCASQGNTFQRKEQWNLGDYWGKGYDSLTTWKSWPPVTPVSVSFPGVGSYTVQLMDSSICGVSTKTTNITIISPPTAGITAPPGPFCGNSSITFTNSSPSGYFYKWNFGDGGGYVSAPFGPVAHTYTATGTFTVKLVAYVVGTGSCNDTAQTVVNILPSPLANFMYSPVTGCNSLSSVTFTDMSTGATTWTWTLGNGNTFVGPNPPPQSYTTTGTFPISLTVTAANACSSTKLGSVTVYQSPVAAFAPTFACQGVVTSFTDQSTSAPSNTITTWKWDFGDGSPVSAAQNPSHAYGSAGTFTVKLVVNSAFCSDSISTPVTINPTPVSSFTLAPSSGCPNLGVTFTNTSAGATSYLWDFGVGSSTSTATNPTFTYTNASPAPVVYTASLTAYSAAGCTNISTQTLTVFEKPAVSFTASPTSGCSPLAVTFTNTTIGGAAYNWDFNDGNISSAPAPTHTFVNSTSSAIAYTVNLVVYSASGCKDSAQMVVNVSPAAASSFTASPASGCSPLAVTFTALGGATSYNWDFGDGNTSTLASPAHTYTNVTPGNITYTASLIASNGFGCNDTVYNTITVAPTPVAGFTYNPVSGCFPLVVNFTNTSMFNAANNWDFGDGNLSTMANTTHVYISSTFTSSTTFTVQLLVFNSFGCRDSVQHTVTLLDRPRPAFAVDTPACSNKLLHFTDASLGATSYTWNFGNSNTSNLMNPTQQYVNTGTTSVGYNVQLIVSNVNGCYDSIKRTIYVHPQPSFTVSAVPDSGCAPLRVFFPAISGVSSYTWNFGDGGTALTGSPTHTFMNTGSANTTYTTQLIATDAYGCADTATRPVTVFPKPVANFSVDQYTVVAGNQFANFTNLSTGYVTSNWSFGDGGISTATNPSHLYQLAGQYNVRLVVISTKGCKDTLDMTVEAEDENVIKVPNAFTPNLNGSNGGVYSPTALDNDVFHPIIKGVDRARYELSIYSRWGELLFVTKDIDIGWDGYYKGQLCTQDVYVWKIKAITIDGVIIDKAGDVLLLR